MTGLQAAPWPGPDNLIDPRAFAPRYRLAIRLPLRVFWSLPGTARGSSARSLPPLVHGFPDPADASGIARRWHTAFSSACSSPSAWSSGFSPPRCCQRLIGPASSVLPVDLPPSATSPLWDHLVGSVLCCLWQHQQQGRRASLGKTHHLTICRPASCQVGSPDIRPCLVTSARPPSQHHIAGSLFATYTTSASCFLQTSRFRLCPCLVGVVLPSGNGGPLCPRSRLERRPVRHARHT